MKNVTHDGVNWFEDVTDPRHATYYEGFDYIFYRSLLSYYIISDASSSKDQRRHWAKKESFRLEGA